MKGKRVAIYVRVSTKDQKVDMQIEDLKKYCENRNFVQFNTYNDVGISGTKESRSGLNQLMEDARKRKFDIVLVWRFDRFARSTKHLVNALHEFRNLSIDFISYQENIDTSSPLGEAIFTIISAMSTLERDIICERVRGGLRNARSKGIKLGRPQNDIDINKVIAYREQGKSFRDIAKIMGVSVNLAFRTVKAYKPLVLKTLANCTS